MKRKYILSVILLALSLCASAAETDFSRALKLYDRGLYSRAMELFSSDYSATGNVESRGYTILCAAALEKQGYLSEIETFAAQYPFSELIPRLRFAHACNLFEKSDYAPVVEILSGIDPDALRRSQKDTYLFDYAFSLLETNYPSDAEPLFREVVSRPKSDYTAPSCYSLGYICYQKNDFTEAIDWFGKASSDIRFSQMADYYILECKFMLKDYEYVVKKGPKMYTEVPEDRQPRLSRIIAESYLVRGDAASARKYYEMSPSGKTEMSRSDRFFAGSVLYATGDYKGAADNFSKMGERTDSIGQIASYQMAYSYIKTRNKVAAMSAFREASELSYDRGIEKDALLNYAKLAFDLNKDVSVFKKYLKKYPETDSEDIYGYIAITALYSKDYQGAIDAYDNIDELSSEMRHNYMKANYLRAKQLMDAGSWRAASGCLKAVTFYAPSDDPLNQMAKYWLAETLYRSGDYSGAVSSLKELYNISALEGREEGSLITYNLASAYFRVPDYAQSEKWFTEYASQKRSTFRKDALTRAADSRFLSGDYAGAAEAYGSVADDYYDPDDIYPYWQSAVAYGLNGKLGKKIERLSEVKDASAEAEYYPDALLELGRSYVENKNAVEAGKCFDLIVSDVSDSSYVAQALLEKAMLARNSKDNETALAYYKRVAENMKGTEYADNALLAIESIYRSEGKAKEYLAYTEWLGSGAAKTEKEKENLYFSSAEQLFTDRRYDRAIPAFEEYLKAYPGGEDVVKAEYCIAECYRLEGENEKARDAYETVIERGESLFCEASMQRYAELSFALEHFDDAYLAYTALQEKTSSSTTKSSALTGRMTSAFKARRYGDAASCAEAIIASSPEAGTLRDAQYIRAKSLLSLSRRSEALEMFEALSADPSDAYGAEARLTIIQDKFDSADYKSVENLVYSFSESGTKQNYYLAKAFIVLGDAFAEQGDLTQAKATFESVRDGYKASSDEDDVLENVDLRLQRLSEMNVK